MSYDDNSLKESAVLIAERLLNALLCFARLRSGEVFSSARDPSSLYVLIFELHHLFGLPPFFLLHCNRLRLSFFGRGLLFCCFGCPKFSAKFLKFRFFFVWAGMVIQMS